MNVLTLIGVDQGLGGMDWAVDGPCAGEWAARDGGLGPCLHSARKTVTKKLTSRPSTGGRSGDSVPRHGLRDDSAPGTSADDASVPTHGAGTEFRVPQRRC